MRKPVADPQGRAILAETSDSTDGSGLSEILCVGHT
jgi:hypothetical protein